MGRLNSIIPFFSVTAAPTAMVVGPAPVSATPATEQKPKEEDRKKKVEEEKAKEDAALEGLGTLFG